MRTTADLRQAMHDETAEVDLPHPVDLAGLKRRVRRRELRRAGVAGIIGLVVAIGISVAVLASTTDTPLPPADPHFSPTITMHVDPSFPTSGQLIATGVAVGADHQLVLRFADSGDPNYTYFTGGLLDPHTGVVRDLGVSVESFDQHAHSGGFAGLGELDDRAGGVIDYGLYIGVADRITVQAGGAPVEAQVTRWSTNTAYTVFWVDRKGTPILDASGRPASPGPGQPLFTAYDHSGHRLGTSAGKAATRTDGGLNLQDAPTVGDVLDAGVPVADGGELLFWFSGGGTTTLLHAGTRNPVTGKLTDLKLLTAVQLPLDAVGFYHAVDNLAGTGGTHIVVTMYVGSATKVVTGAPGATSRGFGRWSAHPEFLVSWVAGVAQSAVPQTGAVAYDAAGNVIGTYAFGN